MINAIKDKRARRHQTSKLPKGKNGGIELILLHEIEKLGKIGDLVEVKRGYAVNYLIPQGLAAVATEKTRAIAAARKAEAEAAHAKKIADRRSGNRQEARRQSADSHRDDRRRRKPLRQHLQERDRRRPQRKGH